MRNDVAILRTKTATGATVSVAETPIFVETKSIGYGEFYAAYQTGLNPKLTLLVDIDDWRSACIDKQIPTEAEYDDVIYNIIRTYQANGILEVVLG